MLDIQKVQNFANDVKKKQSEIEKRYQQMGDYLLTEKAGLLSTMIKGGISKDNAYTIWFAMSALALDDMQRFKEVADKLANNPEALQEESERLNTHQFASHNLLHLKIFVAKNKLEKPTFNSAYDQCQARMKSTNHKMALGVGYAKRPNPADPKKFITGMKNNLISKNSNISMPFKAAEGNKNAAKGLQPFKPFK